MQDLWSLPFWAEAAFAGTAALIRLVLSPTSRTFWPYLVVSLMVAAWLWRRERRAGPKLPAHLDVFSHESWLGRSAMNDYWLVLLNAIVFGAVVAALVPDPSRLVAGVAGWMQHALPLAAGSPAAWAPVMLAATLFLADDFIRYALHWLEHRVPVLWELHKVHHSAEALNFVTAERHHPLSLLVFGIGFTVTAASVNGVFLWAYGAAMTPASILGANAFWLVGNLLASSLRHSPVWLSFGPGIERWLLSPAQHQIHHSEDPRHFGTNLGSTLAIWDRLFGSLFVTTRNRIPLTFGIGDETRSYRSVGALYWRPIVRIVRVASRRRDAPVSA
jgi:sterol desaturase/sphingolipid hydroxylase (fatty acid hydroxylase superfamily)